jgi:predicted secreted protein
MDFILGVAVFILLWWMAFFVMLPWGAKSAHEAGVAVDPGSEAGAPLAHRLKFKALAAAGIAAVVWGVLYWAMASGWLLNAAIKQAGG